MPELISNQEHDEGEPLKFTLNLTNVERPEAWEGWLFYEVSLMNGDDVLAASSRRAMMNDELIYLCEILEESSEGEFEPMEPDFQLIFHPTKYQDTDEIFVFMNEAMRRGEGFYSKDGIGLKFSLDKSARQEFATQLRGQYATLTKGISRER